MHKMIYQLRYFIVLIIIAGFMKLCQTWVDNDWLEALFFYNEIPMLLYFLIHVDSIIKGAIIANTCSSLYDCFSTAHASSFNFTYF